MKPNFKYAVIHRHCERYPIKEMCCFFEVSRSGYYKHLKHIEHPAKDFKLAEKIRAKQETCRRTYGYRRMKLWLDSEGIAKNPKTVLRIMHKYGLLSEVRRRKKWQKMGDDKPETFEEANKMIDDYIYFYNHERIFSGHNKTSSCSSIILHGEVFCLLSTFYGSVHQ